LIVARLLPPSIVAEAYDWTPVPSLRVELRRVSGRLVAALRRLAARTQGGVTARQIAGPLVRATPTRIGCIRAYNERMTTSVTLTQRLALETAKQLPGEAGARLVRGAYDADEPACTEAEALDSYYSLSHRMAALSAAVLRGFPGLGAYATAIERQGALSTDGAAASEQTLRTARAIMDEEPPPLAADPIFVRAARTTLMEAQSVIRVAATFRYGSGDTQELHRGAAAASRALAAAQGFVNVPEEARQIVEAMRGSASYTSV
jgi:hypothetical protein